MDITLDELSEIVTCSKDPVYFISEYFCVRDHHTGQPQVLDIGDEETAFILALHEERRIIVDSTERGNGKTSLVVAYLFWHAYFNSLQNSVILAPSLDIGRHAIQKIFFAFDNLPEFLKMSVTRRNRDGIEFSNSSRIKCLLASENVCRGMSISKLFIDEYDGIRPVVRDTLLMNILPAMGASNSSMFITSCSTLQSETFKSTPLRRTSRVET